MNKSQVQDLVRQRSGRVAIMKATVLDLKTFDCYIKIEKHGSHVLR